MSLTPTPRRLIVGISGASGAIYGVRMLMALREAEVQSHLVISESARMTLQAETGLAVLNLPKEETFHVGLHFPV